MHSCRPLLYEWEWHNISWKAIVRHQHWGSLLLLIPAAVIAGVAHMSIQDRPVVRPALLYDASISSAGQPEAISNSLATAYNWIVLIVAVLLVEFGVFWRRHSLTAAVAATLHTIWSCAVNFVVVLAITEVTKPFTGRLRPDFLARCHPANADAPCASHSTHLSSNAVGFSTLYLGQMAANCTNTAAEAVRDGRLSYPSGHASNSMSVAWFTTLYLIWSLHLRADESNGKQPYSTGGSIWIRLMHEVLHAVAYAVVLLALCLSWFIGMTRFWDNRHHISDILGGFLLAVTFTTPYAIKAIGLHMAMHRCIDSDWSTHAVVPSAAEHSSKRTTGIAVKEAVHPAGAEFLGISVDRDSRNFGPAVAAMAGACASSAAAPAGRDGHTVYTGGNSNTAASAGNFRGKYARQQTTVNNTVNSAISWNESETDSIKHGPFAAYSAQHAPYSSAVAVLGRGGGGGRTHTHTHRPSGSRPAQHVMQMVPGANHATAAAAGGGTCVAGGTAALPAGDLRAMYDRQDPDVDSGVSWFSDRDAI